MRSRDKVFPFFSGRLASASRSGVKEARNGVRHYLLHYLSCPNTPPPNPRTQEQHSNQSQSPLLQALESQSQPSTAARPSGWQLPEKQSSIYDLKWNSLNRSQVPGQKNAKLGSLPGLPPPEELFLVCYACVWNGKVWIAEPCPTLHHMKGKSGPRSQSLRRLKQNNLKFIASLSYIARLCSSK